MRVYCVSSVPPPSDFHSRVKQVQIRDPPQDLPRATVDDIRASVKGLTLGSHSPSTRIRKATSSQSLNSEPLSLSLLLLSSSALAHRASTVSLSLSLFYCSLLVP